MTRRPKRQYSSEIVNLENMISNNHFLRVIDKYFDWNFIYEEVEKIVKCNEEVPIEELLGEKEIIVSDTDKDAGMLYKSEKKRCLDIIQP